MTVIGDVVAHLKPQKFTVSLYFVMYCFITTCSVECYRHCIGGRGSALEPAGGAHDAPPDPLVGWGRGTPPPHSSPLGAFGSSILALSALRSSCPPWKPGAPPLL